MLQEVSAPSNSPIIINASLSFYDNRPPYARQRNRTLVYRPLSPSVYMMQRIATQKATAKSPKRLHAWMFYATTKTLDSHTLVQLINGISTDIDILCEQLIRHLVFLQDVVIRPRAREGRPEQEAEHPAAHGGTKSALRAGARGLMITLGPVLGAVRFG